MDNSSCVRISRFKCPELILSSTQPDGRSRWRVEQKAFRAVGRRSRANGVSIYWRSSGLQSTATRIDI